MERQPSVTLRLQTSQRRCVVIFGQTGTEYSLSDTDEVLVHVYGHATGPEDVDVEVLHEPEMIALWIPSEYRAWNKAGIELLV